LKNENEKIKTEPDKRLPAHLRKKEEGKRNIILYCEWFLRLLYTIPDESKSHKVLTDVCVFRSVVGGIADPVSAQFDSVVNNNNKKKGLFVQ
jgi:hypothetical protein